MKKIFLLLTCAFLFAVSGSAQDWKTFKSTDENFQISLPAEPEQQRTPGTDMLGYNNHIYSLNNSGILYTISVSTFNRAPTEGKDIKRRLDFAEGLVLTVTEGKLLANEDITLEGFPGRLVQIEKNKQIWTLRSFIVREHMYQLMTTAPKVNDLNPAVVKFFDSFKLLRTPE